MSSSVVIDEYVTSARQQCSMSNYEEAVFAYRMAQDKISSFLRSVQDDVAIKHYRKVHQEITDELHLIDSRILPGIREVVRSFDIACEEESRDSPPVDPQNASIVRPTAINIQNYGGRQKPSNNQAKVSNNGGNYSRVNRQTIGQGNTKNQRKSMDHENSSSSNKVNSSKATYSNVDDKKVDQSVIEKPLDVSGFDSGLVTLIENGIILQDETPSVSFQRVAGLSDAKSLLFEAIVWPVKNPKLFEGIRRPSRGICMFGPPGTGKTMLAKAVASECKTTFFNVSSAVLTSKYRGDSEKLVKILFDVARARAPSTIFIDEVDSICSRRGASDEHEASRRAKSELLVQMDGLSSGIDDKLVVVLAATNFPWDLDEALIRRLEKRIYIPLPDFDACLNLLQTLLADIHVDENVKLEDVAQKLKGYSGSDIANVCRDAAMAPMRELFRKKVAESGGIPMAQIPEVNDDVPDLIITMEHFDAAIHKIMPSVSEDKLLLYENWMKKYGSK